MASEVELIPELSGTERQSLEDISKDVDVPLIVVANLYKVERALLEDAATVPTFIPVIASRNVRMKLKNSHH
jgi:hypothetical protein